jgi:hypothetical protein
MRWYVQLLDKADRILDPQVFDGRKCVGFEVSTAKYGNNPQGPFDRIWFDVETRLPARIERHRPDSGFDVYVESDFDAPETMIIIHDQFQYLAKVPMDLFLPPSRGLRQRPPGRNPHGQRQTGEGRNGLCPGTRGLKERIVAALTA